MKMKEETKKKIRGSITVLMVIILLPMMTMSAIIVDSSRINMARSMISSAGDLTMNTALANYDTILKDVYGLFAMSQDQTDKELADSLKKYFATTLVSYGVVNEAESGDYVDGLIGDFKTLLSNTENGKFSNFLDMNVVDFTATKESNSSLANPDVMRSQIVEYMKYRAPINFGLSFLDSVNAFKNVQSQNNVVKAQVEAQQSSQGVTEACQAVITAIRDYDKLIDSINSGEKVVKGENNKSDGKSVTIDKYHTQVDKYRSAWGDKYEHANKLNLVFLLKAPSTSSLYLKNMKVASSQWFIKTDGSAVNYANSGINIEVSLQSAKDAARQQLQSQIDKLSNTSGLERSTATKYVNKNYLPYSYANGTAFSTETQAINSFVEYEKFLTNSGDLKYSDVKTTLESIYTLARYYENFSSIINQEISAAQTKKTEAANKVTQAGTDANTYYTAVSNNVTNINNARKNYSNNYDFLTGIKNAQNEDLGSVVSAMLAAADVSLPTAKINKSGKSFTNFSGFVQNNFKERSADADNMFLKVYKEIVNSSLKNNEEYKKICSAASSFLTDDSGKSFSDYMKSKAGSASLNSDLYALLNYLYKNSGYVSKIETNISKYNEVINGYSQLVQDSADAKRDYDAKVNERDQMYNRYQSCLLLYNNFTGEYQNDFVYYDRYIATAKSVVSKEVNEIAKQFTAIKNNVNSIIEQLTTIEGKLTTARSAIVTYNENLDSWASANNSYESNNSSDSFSKQNTADIEASRSQYDLDSLDLLKAKTAEIKATYQSFYNRLTDATHFKYGSKKIDGITDADKMKAAVPAGVKDSLPAVVSLQDAQSKFATLYNSDATSAIKSIKFLQPVLQIQFLKYLNSTYPEPVEGVSKTEDVEVDGEEMSVGENSGDFNYESTKNDVSNNSGGSVSDETDANKFGYSYKSVGDLDKTKIPSGGNGGKDGDANGQFDVNTSDNGDIDVSSGFDAQNTALGGILGGIKDVAEGALENTYILSYIFNNFSYNTLVQDEVLKVEKSKVDGKLPLAAIDEAQKLFVESNATFKAVKDKTTTLSNYLKNKNNNYFYGAEIEYLLYGNVNAAKNVTYTKASIYAIRFAFNCIYAFTNSTIRNSTMAIGLAVQAATCGFVPYQIVQIVLQLAMAAAESAVDLKMMNEGLKVPVVKTSDTWSLSIKNAVKSAGQMVANAGADIVKNGVQQLTSGLQGLVDASADQLSNSISDLSENLQDATTKKLEEITDAAFSLIQSEVENVLNDLQFIPYHEQTVAVSTKIEEAFAGLENSITAKLNQKFGGNQLADKILPSITSEISKIVNPVKNDILNAINGISKEAVGNVIVEKMTELKLNMLSYAGDSIEIVVKEFNKIVESVTSKISTDLQSYIGEQGEKLSEEASAAIKEEVTNATNSFINEYLDDDAAISTGTSSSTGSSVASMIQFGYKDYLMLFTFISICANDNAVLSRIADLIQTNVQKATGGIQDINNNAVLHKNASEFKMKEAKTYVSIHASVDLKMLFMNMSFFSDVVSDDAETQVTGQLTPAATIEYNGMMGY